MTIIEQIQEKLPFLTKKQRELANYMLEDPERMAYVTLKEMSHDTNITEMTILKTCNLLGFDNFSSMKYEFRKYSAMQLEQFRQQTAGVQVSTPSVAEKKDELSILKEICEADANSISNYLNHLDPADVFKAADMILAADKVLMFGRGVSYQVCNNASNLFASLGVGCVAVNTELYDEVYATLPLMTPKTLVLVVAYPDYYRTTVRVAEYAHKKHIPVMAMTDNQRSPVCAFSDYTLFTPSYSRMFLNNISLSMHMVSMIGTAISLRMESKIEDSREILNRYSAFSDLEI